MLRSAVLFRRAFTDVCYLLIACIALPFVAWRFARHGKRTPALVTKATGRVDVETPTSKRVWIHAVSVGEVLQVRPLIRELIQRDGELDIVLSTTTASGLKLAREKYADCTIVPFPFDFSWAVRTAFTRIAPNAVVLVELELWPNFIAEANRRQVPLLVANGRLSEKSYGGYARVRRLFEPMFRGLSFVCAQNETYASRFVQLGVARDHVEVTGSIKFDGLATDRDRPEVRELRESFGIAPDERVFMAGSTHDPEESIAFQAWQEIRKSHDDVRLLLVPRHPERFDSVACMVEDQGQRVIRRSNLVGSESSQHGSPSEDKEAVLLLDTIGELSACWALADVAFVGGTLTQRGGQNMLEPAAYGCPVLMGQNVWNFAEIAAELLEHGGAVSVERPDQLAECLDAILSDDERHRSLGDAARAYALSQAGAAEKTADAIVALLGQAVTVGSDSRAAA